MNWLDAFKAALLGDWGPLNRLAGPWIQVSENTSVRVCPTIRGEICPSLCPGFVSFGRPTRKRRPPREWLGSANRVDVGLYLTREAAKAAVDARLVADGWILVDDISALDSSEQHRTASDPHLPMASRHTEVPEVDSSCHD